MLSLPRLAGLLAAGAATFTVHSAAADAALPQKCAKDGVCFTKTTSGAKTKFTVTGTAGNDNVVISNVRPFGNNNLSTLGIDGLDTHVTDNSDVTLVINALGGDDHVTLNLALSGNALYGSSTIDGGAGDDVLAGANRADVLLGGAGDDQLTGGAGADTLDGGSGSDVAHADALDALVAIETVAK